MIRSAGQVSPHVHVCFGTQAAPLTSPNSCKFSVKSCLLLHESAREPLSLPAPRLAHVAAGLESSPAPPGARLGRASAGTHLPQAGRWAWRGIHRQPLTAHSLLSFSSYSGVASFPDTCFPWWNPLLLESSDFVIIPASMKSKFSAVQMRYTEKWEHDPLQLKTIHLIESPSITLMLFARFWGPSCSAQGADALPCADQTLPDLSLGFLFAPCRW